MGLLNSTMCDNAIRYGVAVNSAGRLVGAAVAL